MTVDTAARVSSRAHVVLFYENTEQLVTTVAQFLVDGVLADEPAIVVATTSHIVAFEDAMVAAGVDIVAARASGNLFMIDAEQAMSQFLIGDWPEASRFDSVFGDVIRRLSDSGRPVRVYGEMVALLWDAGHVAAAFELEALWNELGQHVPFSLMCAYPATSVSDHGVSFQQLCQCHSAVVGARGDAARNRATRSFLGDAGSLKGARQFVVDTLRSWHLDHLCDDGSIVVSELATNAVLHAASDFTVTLSLEGRTVRLSVVDESAQLPVVRTPSPTTISGRGLVLVAALGARWGSEVVDDGKEVWVELRA
jgi:MEDS: MEthanogen/methylotroph, DcmR Sensory domain/Histidine kinase-like ATPase domain